MNILTKPQIDSLIKTGYIQLSAGTFCFPIDFSNDFGSKDLTIQGVAGQTVITSYDGTPATDFSPKELDTTQPDTYKDGIYVVKKHPYTEYGGGTAHLNLKALYNTNSLNCWYVQGTILKKVNGVWSRHYTGYGFKTKGNMIIKDVIFDNCQFYLLSPFGEITSDRFVVDNCVFKNVSRVLASMSYAGIDQDATWFSHLQCYSSWGVFRFKNFTMTNNVFSGVHTSIAWGFPPSETIRITDNIIENSNTLVSGFNLFMKNYADDTFFINKSSLIFKDNTFRNIVTDHGYTTCLLRTSGRSIVTNNTYLNVTPQPIFLSGGDSLVTENIFSLKTAPLVILVKEAGQVLNVIQGNMVDSPQAIFMAVEGQSSTIIRNNNITSKIVYSRNQSDSSSGSTRIVDNTIYSPAIFSLGSKVLPVSFKYMEVSNNDILLAFDLNYGNVNLENLVYTNNTLRMPMKANLTLAKKLTEANNRVI